MHIIKCVSLHNKVMDVSPVTWLLALRRRRRLLQVLLLVLVLLLPNTAVRASPPPPPLEAGKGSSARHILFFVIDDLGFADLSYKSHMYGGTAPPPTPHIDALALSGVRLESYYVNQLCSPTRTALLSGRYAYTIGMEDGVIVDGVSGDLPLNLLTIGDQMRRAGFETSAYGKVRN